VKFRFQTSLKLNLPLKPEFETKAWKLRSPVSNQMIVMYLGRQLSPQQTVRDKTLGKGKGQGAFNHMRMSARTAKRSCIATAKEVC